MRSSIIILFFLFISYSTTGQTDSIRREGKASFYHDRFHGQETSNGETYDMDDFTAAHKKLPFNTLVLVTNKKNNKSVVVRINDRGPFRKSRIIDLSLSAARKISMVRFGVVPVKISLLNYLDNFPLTDSLLHDDETWDCYGKKKELSGITVFAWRTNDWKHAFYMASNLCLDYKTDALSIYIAGEGKNRNFYILFTNLEKEGAGNIINMLKKDGFSHARLFDRPSLRARLRGDQSEK